MNILFVCTGNTCRSPMAEGILKKITIEKDLDVDSRSAGIFASGGSSANENAILAMQDIGIDIEHHVSKNISDELIDSSDLILTMTMGHKDLLIERYPKKRYKIFLLNEYAFGQEKDIKDPYGRDKLEYDKSRDEILKAVEKIYGHI
ncbi:MAG: low molecular weight protein arginine phosphatase [Tissierella sp.]|uniref:low molecular weight protein arginine phosphatase n=1 Tax=Tissierella sp. TaxID=41274 RepID=UPI003F97CD39